MSHYDLRGLPSSNAVDQLYDLREYLHFFMRQVAQRDVARPDWEEAEVEREVRKLWNRLPETDKEMLREYSAFHARHAIEICRDYDIESAYAWEKKFKRG